LLAIARAIVSGGNRGGVSAEDVVQQALTNLYQHRDRYDWREPGGLMRRAVVNEALRVLRQPRTTPVADDYPEGGGRRGEAGGAAHGAGSFASRGNTAAHPWSPADPMIDQETVQRVRQAIGRLPEHFRAALVLCEYEGMAYTQIAEVLGASVPQVKTWLHRGRRQLAEMLKDFVGAEPKQPKHRQKVDDGGASSNGKARGDQTRGGETRGGETRPASGPAKRGNESGMSE
jgi:RNA polymerase sigma-70 factor (ECF subfamily)